MRFYRLLECLGTFALAGWMFTAITLQRGSARTRWLEDQPEAPDDQCPTLSIVIPACNEADTIRPAMQSLLEVDYPRLDLVAVDDRSTDGTGEILDDLARGNARLRVLHIRDLPQGWLGKNHALWQGARNSRGDWILFTDADVVFRNDALRRSIAMARRDGLVHLSLAPRVVLHGCVEQILVSYFIVMFNAHVRPWAVGDEGSFRYVGIGAFNLVTRRAYFEIGGHQALRMEVADDMKLGKLMKRVGRSGFAIADRLVRVRWVIGLRGFVDGLTKNMFAGVEYRWSTVAWITPLLIGTHLFVYPGLIIGTRRSRLFFALTLAAMVVAATPPPRRQLPGEAMMGDYPGPLCGLGYPFAAGVWLFILWRSALLAEFHGGITWRGTRYPLAELRAGVV